MYSIGDKILYPPHGAGVIEGIEERVVLGKKQMYYILKMPSEDMTVMIPTEGSEEIGVRYVITKEEALKVLEAFRKEPVVMDDNWNRRQRENIVKIKSGDIYEVLSVVKALMLREKTKGLSTSERKMLNSSKRIMTSEIVLSGAAGMGDVESILNDTVEELLK
ncbi:MAG: CarD family transcriptional regulator [Clostridia bacterium]|nr:CarD family transcriptional regulator [Clostridia bacterium]